VGTSSFQIEKESSLNMIKKKQNNLDEINKMIKEDITPKILQLNRDKQSFQKWKTTKNEISLLDKIIKAYDFYNNARMIDFRIGEA